MANKKCTAAELIGANARVVLRPLTEEEMPIKGLNSYKLPGLNRETITVDDFERDFAGQLAGGGSYSELNFSGNVVAGDPSQDEIQVRMEQNTEFSDMWVFTRKGRGDFWAMDLARNECGKIMFTSFDYQEAGKSDIVQVNVTCAVDGTNGIFNIHTDELVYTIASGVVTATDGSFLSLGFKKDMSVILETGNAIEPYIYGIVTAATETTLTLADADVSRSSTGKIHGMSKIVPVE